MAEHKSSRTTKEIFDDAYKIDSKTGKIEIYFGEESEDSFSVDTIPDKNGKYHATAYYETDTYIENNYVGDTSEEALIHALRARLYRYQTMAYMYAEIIDMLGYNELTEVDDGC